jgi:hypothetical protein
MSMAGELACKNECSVGIPFHICSTDCANLFWTKIVAAKLLQMEIPEESKMIPLMCKRGSIFTNQNGKELPKS